MKEVLALALAMPFLVTAWVLVWGIPIYYAFT